MDFPIRDCWDCPVPLLSVVALYCAVIACVLRGTRLLASVRSAGSGRRWLGRLFLVASLLVWFLGLIYLPQWGIVVWENETGFAVLMGGTAYLLLGILSLLLAVAAVLVWRRSTLNSPPG